MELIQIYGAWYLGIVLIAMTLCTKISCATGTLERRGKVQIVIGSLFWPFMAVVVVGCFVVHLLSLIFARRGTPQQAQQAGQASADKDATNLLILLGVTNVKDAEEEILHLYQELEKSLGALRTYASGVQEIRQGQLALATIEAINRVRVQKGGGGR